MIVGHGVDIIENERIAKAIERWGDSLLNHLFTEHEITYARKHRFPVPHFAGRFAAKEAVLKALPDLTGIAWKDIEITNDQNGKPACRLNKKGFSGHVVLSISHTANYAIASAIITNQP